MQMPGQKKEAPMKEIPKKDFGPELPFMDSLEPGKPLSPQANGLARNFVRPQDRVAKVSTDAPKEEPTSVFTPDKSENYSIRDKAPQDR